VKGGLYIWCGGTGVGGRCSSVSGGGRYSNKVRYIGEDKVGGSIHGRKDICDFFFFLECLLWTVGYGVDPQWILYSGFYQP
jgi:hypothetical protein